MSQLSRRDVLQGVASAAIASQSITAGTVLAGQRDPSAASPATRAGTTFRAAVRHQRGHAVQQLTLLPISGRQVLVRTQATQACYTIVKDALGSDNWGDAEILGHGGVGVVDEVGPMVTRLRVGDRVIVGVTPHCGACYQCLQGRPDACQMLANAMVPVAEMQDGTRVVQSGNVGGFAEFMVPFEESCTPIFSDLPADQLALLSCVSGTGLASTTVFVPIHPGADVVVMGAGPIGLSAIQGARIQGAAQIIAVEPIRYRREVALTVGATRALDPNVEGDSLVETIRELCKGPTDRPLAGGRAGRGRGPYVTIDCSGADRLPPKVERGPDPTGIKALQQAWECTAAGGHIITIGTGQSGTVSFPAGRWGNHGRTQHCGIYGGIALRRDVPRYVRLIEAGLFDAKAIATANYPLDRTLEAFQAAADRTVVSAQVVFG